MGGGLSTLSSQSSAADDNLPVTDPDKCQHKFCEKWGPGHYHCADCHSTIQDETLIASEDAIIDSIVDESVAEDGVYRGVSIQFLVDFATTCNCWDMTTRDVRRRFVMPATRASRCRFVELPEMQQSPQRYVGRAGTFVSHTWGARFGDLVAALCDGGADRSRYVWVDIFAVRQWPSHKPDLDFSAVVRQCGSFVVVCSSLPEVSRMDAWDIVSGRAFIPSDSRNQIAFLRVWCLVEVHAAIASGLSIVLKGGSSACCVDNRSFKFLTNTEMLVNLAFMVDIESADATVPSDKERILNEIRASEGGVDAVNRAVRGAVTGGSLSDPVVQCAACDDQGAIDEILKSPSEYIVSAAGSGYVKLLQKLIDAGADIDHVHHTSEESFTAVEAATCGGYVDCVSLLLKSGCEVRDFNDLLYLAAQFGHSTVIKFLLTYGNHSLDDDNIFRKMDNALVVHTAALNGHAKVINVLLDHGYDVNVVYDSMTPLSATCIRGHIECAKLLIERGANKHFVQDEVLSSLTYAAAHNRDQILQLFIDSGMTPNLEAHCAAVIYAAATGSLKCLEILIKNGCDLETRLDGYTALMVAAEAGHVACLQCLIDAGSKLDAVDDEGRTAATRAEKRRQTECVELLRSAMAQRK